MKKPTERQLEAYYWTGIVGLNLLDTSEKMGISERALRYLLDGFYKIRPKLKPDFEGVPNNKNSLRVEDIDSYDIKHKF